MKKLLLITLILFLAVAFSAYAQEDLSFLSAEEQSWLVENGNNIKLAPERNYPPFIFVENGTVQGLSFDYARAIENKLGITFKIIDSANLSTHLESLKSGNADVITSLKETPERAEFLLFTEPYVEVPAVIIVRDDFEKKLKVEDLNENTKVAVGDGYGVHSYLKNLKQNIAISPKPDDLVGLRSLVNGDVDVLVMDIVSASYFIEKNNIENLKILGEIGYFYDLSFASRKDLPILASILEKALAQISETERSVIDSKWSNIDFTENTETTTSFSAWYVIGTILLVFAIILIWKKARYQPNDFSDMAEVDFNNQEDGSTEEKEDSESLDSFNKEY